LLYPWDSIQIPPFIPRLKRSLENHPVIIVKLNFNLAIS